VIAIESNEPGMAYAALQIGISVAVFALMAALFMALVNGRELPHIPFLSAGLARIGFISFSWYLLHETIGITFLATFNQFLPAWLSLVLAMVGTFCAAVLFANLFEWRFRKPVEHLARRVLDTLGEHVGFLKPLRTQPQLTAAE
jgi:peptidoglycan/LPS O-acetylase OafA/YrhL